MWRRRRAFFSRAVFAFAASTMNFFYFQPILPSLSVLCSFSNSTKREKSINFDLRRKISPPSPFFSLFLLLESLTKWSKSEEIDTLRHAHELSFLSAGIILSVRPFHMWWTKRLFAVSSAFFASSLWSICQLQMPTTTAATKKGRRGRQWRSLGEEAKQK